MQFPRLTCAAEPRIAAMVAAVLNSARLVAVAARSPTARRATCIGRAPASSVARRAPLPGPWPCARPLPACYLHKLPGFRAGTPHSLTMYPRPLFLLPLLTLSHSRPGHTAPRHGPLRRGRAPVRSRLCRPRGAHRGKIGYRGVGGWRPLERSGPRRRGLVTA